MKIDKFHLNNCQNFALILAAGLSTRMGVCKTTLPWHNNKTLLRYQAEQFLLANITPIVVLGSHNAHRRSDCPPGSRVVINSNSNLGKITSILSGLKLLTERFSTVTISAVDQPRASYVYQTLLQTYQRNRALITAPIYQEKLGHPLLFSHELLPELIQITDSNLGLREIIRKRYLAIDKISFNSSEIFTDLNYKDTYQSELKKYSKLHLPNCNNDSLNSSTNGVRQKNASP